MNLTVTGRHVEITDELRAHVTARVEHALGGYARIEFVRVVLNLEKKSRCEAEVVVQMPGPGKLESKAESADMYLAFDSALEKTARQLAKWFDKVRDHGHQPGLGEIEARAARG